MLKKTIDSSCPISQSKLWGILKDLYRSEGTDIWNRVPHCGTNNLFLARRYASQIAAIRKSVQMPIRVIELGAGVSQLSYYLMKLDPDIHAVLFDLRPDFCDFIKAQPQWQGVAPERYDLIEGGCEALYSYLKSEDHNHWYDIFITHYVLDSMPTDVWQRKDDGWSPVGLKLCYPWSAKSKLDIDSLSLNFFESQDGSYDPDYLQARDESAGSNLRKYLTMPVGAIALFENLRHLCKDATWLIADKVLQGYENENYGFFRDYAWSVNVNIKALTCLARMKGATATIDSEYPCQQIHLCMISWGLSFDVLKHDAMLVDYFHLHGIAKNASVVPIDHALALLRFAGYDPWMLRSMMSNIDAEIQPGDHRYALWIAALLEVADWCYVLFQDSSLLAVADLLMRAKSYSNADEILARHERYYGSSAKFFTLRGNLAYRLGNKDDASKFWRRALKIEPDSEHVARLLELVG